MVADRIGFGARSFIFEMVMRYLREHGCPHEFGIIFDFDFELSTTVKEGSPKYDQLSERRRVSFLVTHYYATFINLRPLQHLIPHRYVDRAGLSIRDKDWEMISNHDSCWKDEIQTRLSEAWYAAYEEVHKHVPEEHRAPPVMVDTFNWGMFSSFNFTRVVKMGRDPEKKDHPYNWTIEKQEKFEDHLAALEWWTQKIREYREKHAKPSRESRASQA